MITDYEKYLSDWIDNVLSKPESILNNLPSCPYARAALKENKVKFQRSKNYIKDIDHLFDSWNTEIDVVVLVLDDDVDPTKLVEDVKTINEKYVPLGFGCLEDHVSILETLDTLIFNNGKYNLILCQPLDKLNKAAEALKSKGYYKNWSEEFYDSVVSWRFPKTS
jgi:hypothetical protein